MARVGVILSGCGKLDGSEIHEATLTLLHLAELGLQYECIAPYEDLVVEMDHGTMKPTGARLNAAREASRIARSKVRDIREVKASDYDALIFPGGLGAAKNLCDWYEKGAACKVHPQVERIINEYYTAKKPLGFICIAPVLAGAVLGRYGVELTVGSDKGTASQLESLGVKHFNHAVDEAHIDRKNRIVSTPAYMVGPGIADISKGIRKLVEAIRDML